MKNVSQDYVEKEEASQRQPVELYHIQHRENHWYYTSGDKAVDFNHHTWIPATIKRSSTHYDAKLEGTNITVTFARTDPAVARYLAQSPVELSSITIYKLFRDQDPMVSCLIFTGVILSVTVKGLAAEAKCAGIDYIINHQFLNWRYQPECNHTVFSRECGLNEDNFKLTTTVNVDETGTKLISGDFSTKDDGWWTLGVVRYNDEERLIVDHKKDKITIMEPFRELNNAGTVDVFPGCNGSIDTCINKFNHVAHFLGFPFMPIDNPALWVNR